MGVLGVFFYLIIIREWIVCWWSWYSGFYVISAYDVLCLCKTIYEEGGTRRDIFIVSLPIV